MALLLFCSAIPPFGSAQALQIPHGMRAVKIRVASVLSVSPGVYVDVLVTTKRGQTRTVLQNVKVAASHQNTRVVTFLVSPDDAAESNDCR